MRKTVNWKKIWNDFDVWLKDAEKRESCKTCGLTDYRDTTEWKDWQDQIQKLVDAQVREIMEKKV